jgi:outer membrane protein OmpA-like peptidoglycan-associated protein
MNKLIYLLGLWLMFAVASFAQNDAAPTANDQGATATTDQAAPVDPQAAVPDARNGKDPYGRPVQPLGIAQAQVPPLVAPEQKQEFSNKVKDVLFDFNRYDLRADAQAVLQQDAEWLRAHPDVVFTIAGQADPRGDIVYNVYLSDQRALATRDALVKLGVPENQIVFAQGWGKLYPVCGQDDETCWQQDRRAHLEAWSLDAGPLTSAGTSSGGQ